MGIYVYALKTQIHTISNVTVGVAEYRYKESWIREEENLKMYNRFCKRRVEHFKDNKLPFFFVMRKTDGPAFYEGQTVYAEQLDDGRIVGACFDDGVQKKPVGIMAKKGRSWSIVWY